MQGYTGVTDVALDAAGNVVLLGALSLTADFGGGVLVGGPFSGSRRDYTEAFLLKLDPSGTHLWSRVFVDDAAATYAGTLAVDASGHVLVGGLLGEGDMTGRTWTRTPFVSRLAPEGTPLWTHRLAGLDGEVVRVARGAQGTVIFGASFLRSTILAGRRVASVQGTGVLLGALSAQGELLWVRDQRGEAPARSIGPCPMPLAASCSSAGSPRVTWAAGASRGQRAGALCPGRHPPVVAHPELGVRIRGEQPPGLA